MNLITLDDFERNSSGQYIFKPGASVAKACPLPSCEQKACECPHNVHDMRAFLLNLKAAPSTAPAPPPAPALAPAGWFDRYLSNDKQARKQAPLARGLLGYFPNACLHVAHVSHVANDQHNPGQPLQWAFNKSTDEGDCVLRHAIDADAQGGNPFDDDGLLHSAKKAWRALAELERYVLEQYPKAKPGASVTGIDRQEDKK